MAFHAEDRVSFVGLRPRPWETVGTVQSVEYPLVFVLWPADPRGKPRPIHHSQIRKVSS